MRAAESGYVTVTNFWITQNVELGSRRAVSWYPGGAAHENNLIDRVPDQIRIGRNEQSDVCQGAGSDDRHSLAGPESFQRFYYVRNGTVFVCDIDMISHAPMRCRGESLDATKSVCAMNFCPAQDARVLAAMCRFLAG